MTIHLSDQKCTACEGGVMALGENEYTPMFEEIGGEWSVEEGKKIMREWKFKNFKEALRFVNEVGRLAEEENHHPDISLHDWNKVTITLSTHAIGGLSKNDFILASKINNLD